MAEAKRILVVDDDEKVVSTISNYLILKGYGVEVAKTGQEAMAKCRSHFFNLAILDIRLPDMEGTQLLTQLRGLEPRMMNIMLTGYPGFENSVESLNKGADAYIVKPVELEGLLKVIEDKLVEQTEALKMDQKKIVEYIKSRSREIDQQNSVG